MVGPLLKEMIENDGAGESAGGVNFAEVEFDSPDVGDLSTRYSITSIPTLLAFRRGEPQMGTKLMGENIRERVRVREWIEEEATQGSGGGKGLLNKMLEGWRG